MTHQTPRIFTWKDYAMMLFILIVLTFIVGCERTKPVDLKRYAAGNFQPVSSYDDYVVFIRKEGF